MSIHLATSPAKKIYNETNELQKFKGSLPPAETSIHCVASHTWRNWLVYFTGKQGSVYSFVCQLTENWLTWQTSHWCFERMWRQNGRWLSGQNKGCHCMRFFLQVTPWLYILPCEAELKGDLPILGKGVVLRIAVFLLGPMPRDTDTWVVSTSGDFFSSCLSNCSSSHLWQPLTGPMKYPCWADWLEIRVAAVDNCAVFRNLCQRRNALRKPGSKQFCH